VYAGIPMMDFMHADQFQLLIYQAVTDEVIKLMEERDDNLAIRIANAVSKAFTGKT
jgi:hypothetical protein